MKLKVSRIDFEFRSVFRIAYKSRTRAETIRVELSDGERIGRGEALGVSYRGETADSILEQAASMSADVANGISRADLQARLPAGGARNAIDCAMWDLESKHSGIRAWQLAGFATVKPVLSDYTLGIDSPDAMGSAAAELMHHPLLKIKLAGDGLDLDRVCRIRTLRPDADLVVDANQSWDEAQLHELTSRLHELGVSLIEQPLPVGKDDCLRSFKSPIPLCADESCQTRESLPLVRDKYQLVNIKLDKTGGLTEALALADTARRAGLGLMVGCMAGSSLSMAPAFIVAQWAEFADLDGPLLAKEDVPNAIHYQGGWMSAPSPLLWG